MVAGTVLGAGFGLVGTVLKFLDRRGERKERREQQQLVADKGVLEAFVKMRQANLGHDSASAAKLEFEGVWGRFALVARSMVRPGAFYAVTGLFGLTVLGNLFFGWVVDAALLGMLHESLGLVMGFYFTGRNGERLLGVA